MTEEILRSFRNSCYQIVSFINIRAQPAENQLHLNTKSWSLSTTSLPLPLVVSAGFFVWLFVIFCRNQLHMGGHWAVISALLRGLSSESSGGQI
jgi:hypothetical protein